jgi:flagellar hook assembly protein FlgD
LTIADQTGNIVRVINSTLSTGTQNINWNLVNNIGDVVANGTYFLTLEGNNTQITKSVVIAR